MITMTMMIVVMMLVDDYNHHDDDDIDDIVDVDDYNDDQTRNFYLIFFSSFPYSYCFSCCKPAKYKLPF